MFRFKTYPIRQTHSEIRIASYADSYAHFGAFSFAYEGIIDLISELQRYPRGDAQRHCSNGVVQGRDYKQPAFVQGEDSARCGLWDRHPQYVRGEGWSKACGWGAYVQ